MKCPMKMAMKTFNYHEFEGEILIIFTNTFLNSSSGKPSNGMISPAYGPRIDPTGISFSAQTPRPAPLMLDRPT